MRNSLKSEPRAGGTAITRCRRNRISEFHSSAVLVGHDVGEGVIGPLVAGTAETVVGIVRAKSVAVESERTGHAR